MRQRSANASSSNRRTQELQAQWRAKHGFGARKKSIWMAKLAPIEGRQDKANFVRAPLRLQEVVCTLFLAARSLPLGEARHRFFRFLFAINVPRDGGPPLLRQSKQIHSAC
jgi:hypothetical protein